MAKIIRINDINGVVYNLTVKNIGAVSDIQVFSHDVVENQVYFLVMGAGYKITCGFNFEPKKDKKEHYEQVIGFTNELKPYHEDLLNEI